MISSHQLRSLFLSLAGAYGFTYWWPASSPEEVILGAILAQNTSWKNAEKALLSLHGMSAGEIISHRHLEDLIKPAGFYRQKSGYIRNALSYYLGKIENLSLPLSAREELLTLRGIGNETADSIALYAFHERTVPVDSYTIRLLNRFFLKSYSLKDYESLRRLLILSFSTDELMEFHGLVDEHAKRVCTRNPHCGECMIREGCLGRR
ncbi:MAG: endonuclease III domain-containing protein [Thermoplasmata archaeon]